MTKKERILYTCNHRKAYRQLARELGVFRFRHYFHDLEKIFLYLMLSDARVQQIHRAISRHHSRVSTNKDYLDIVLDWESARLTKPDKPLNARETLYAYYPQLEKQILPILRRLGL